MVRLIFVLLLFGNQYIGYAGELKKVIKAYEKGDWPKTEAIISKALESEPTHPGIRYYYSLCYTHALFPRPNLDSARIHIRQSLADYELSTTDILKEMANEGVTHDMIKDQLAHIAQRWYEKTTEQMTLSAFEEFLFLFPDSDHYASAIATRDSLAFRASKQEMSVAGWRTYIEKYPASVLLDRAKYALDSLLLVEFTTTNSRADLEQFVRDQPSSAHVEKALEHLLKIQTLSGDPQTFISFIRQYPRYQTTQWAINALFHIDKESNFDQLSGYIVYHEKSDSLLASVNQSSIRYFPVFDDQYVLMGYGQTPVRLPFDQLPEELLCEGWATDVISGIANGKPLIMAKSQRQIAEGQLIGDLGYGLLLVRQNQQSNIIHKSGKLIASNIETAEIMDGGLLKVKKGGWGLYSLLGLPITDHRFDVIFKTGNFWFFEKDELLATIQFDDIVKSFPEGLFPEFKFHDYELINADLLVGFREDRECLLRSDGKFEVAWGRHHIYPGDSLGYIRDERGYALYGQRDYAFFPYLEANEGFILRKQAQSDWRLTSTKNYWELALKDSVRLLNKHAALVVSTPPKLLFQNQSEYVLTTSDQPTVFSPHAPYILVNGNVKTVLTSGGQKLFSGNYDDIRLEGDSLFVVSFRGKYGLVSASGLELVPMQFDYIDFHDGMASTLQRGKIGAYDLRRNVTLRAVYESKPVRVGNMYLLTQSGKKGLIDETEKIRVPFDYEHIAHWTDKEVWVQKDGTYSLVDIDTNEVLMEASSMEPMRADGSMVKFYGTAGFGIMNNDGDVLVPSGFTDMRMMGADDQAIIVAEQALPESEFYVITYYTLSGEKIYSHAYRKEDYEKVFCDE